MSAQESRLNNKPCPKCGCYLVRNFECGCGEVHSDCCDNCGRWTTLLPGEFTALGPTDVRCDAGPVAHVHSDEEKCQRIRDYVDSVAQASRAGIN